MLQWMDNFTTYNVSGVGNEAHMLNGAYAEASCDLFTDPDPTAGGETVARLGSFRKVLTAPQTTVGVAGRYWLTSIPSTVNETKLWTLRDVNNNSILQAQVDPSGNIQVYRFDNGGAVLIAQTAAPVVVANAWRHMEAKVVIDVAAGSIEVRLEGAPVINVAGIRTTSNVAGVAASCSSVVIGDQGSIQFLFLKDFILWDGTGAHNNSFLGSCQVYTILPSADTAFNWTPSAGATGFNLINELSPDDDAGYISAPFPLPAASTFAMTNLPANVTSVKGVMAVTRTRKTDGGDGQLQVSLISGGVTGNGADRTITTAYTYWWDIFELDPNGAIPWVKASVDAATLKLNRTV